MGPPARSELSLDQKKEFGPCVYCDGTSWLLKGTGPTGTNKVNYIHCPNPKCKGQCSDNTCTRHIREHFGKHPKCKKWIPKGEYYQWVSETKQSMLPCETCHGDL